MSTTAAKRPIYSYFNTNPAHTAAGSSSSSATTNPTPQVSSAEDTQPATTVESKTETTTPVAGATAAPTEAKSDGETTTQLEELTGDLFSDESSCLAHCVSRCLAMGKGIAVTFKSKFGRVQELRAQQKPIGDVAVIQVGSRYVYYLITKERFYHKPTYDSLRNSLIKMKEHAQAHGVTEISMPRIGCGLDGLNWDRVKTMLRRVFADTGIRLRVYQLAEVPRPRI